MNESNTHAIIKFSKELINDLTNNEFVQTLSNLETLENIPFNFIKIVNFGVNKFRDYKFRSFLKYFYKSIIEVYKIEKIDIENLENKLNNKKNLLFLNQLFDSIYMSNSTLCTSILGYYGGLILSEIEEIKYTDLVIINALKNMFDFDLISFVEFYKKKKLNENISIDENMMLLSINKLSALQIFKLNTGFVEYNDYHGEFILNEYSEYFYKIIEKTGILSDKEYEEIKTTTAANTV